jgi:hypothetical protein
VYETAMDACGGASDHPLIVVPPTMAAVLLTGHGGTDRLEYRTDVPTPRPRACEVLIRVAVAGVNNTDVNTRIGWYSKTDDTADATWSGVR